VRLRPLGHLSLPNTTSSQKWAKKSARLIKGGFALAKPVAPSTTRPSVLTKYHIKPEVGEEKRTPY
jgi:hypothetical protein